MLALVVLVHALCANEGEKESKIMRPWLVQKPRAFLLAFRLFFRTRMHCAVSFTNTNEGAEFPIVQSGTNNKGYQFKWLVVFSSRVEKAKQRRPSPFCEVPSACVCVGRRSKANFFMLSMEFHSSRLVSSVLVRFIIRMEVLFWRREKISRNFSDKKVASCEKLENFSVANREKLPWFGMQNSERELWKAALKDNHNDLRKILFVVRGIEESLLQREKFPPPAPWKRAQNIFCIISIN